MQQNNTLQPDTSIAMSIGKGQGPWLPIHTGFAKYLPKDRPYSELEAAFCVQLDYAQGNTVTVSGYSSLWRWSRDKVNGFLKKRGATVQRLEDTGSIQNQRGEIILQIPLQMSGRCSADNRQINFINNKCLADNENRYPADVQQIADRSSVTTIERLDSKRERRKKTPSPLPPKGANDFSVPDWINRESWDGFVDMRARIKKPLTPRAVQLAIKKLDGHRKDGYDPNDMLDNSTMNSWQSLFVPKEAPGHVGTGVRDVFSGGR